MVDPSLHRPFSLAHHCRPLLYSLLQHIPVQYHRTFHHQKRELQKLHHNKLHQEFIVFQSIA
ncbi:hypothetical protein IC790_06390 [Acinetobacter seifertii]|nr:hypothetical protein IC790_06390 [Acinetobacter seifertii]